MIDTVGYYTLLWALMVMVPLLLTIAVETPIVAAFGHFTRRSWKAGLFANTLTNPMAVVLVLAVGPRLQYTSTPAYLAFIAVVEVTVALVEWRVLSWALGWRSRRALLASVLANAVSFAVGTFLFRALAVF
jgi:threonine/homoserine/homoserine lactone efflux protein